MRNFGAIQHRTQKRGCGSSGSSRQPQPWQRGSGESLVIAARVLTAQNGISESISPAGTGTWRGGAGSPQSSSFGGGSSGLAATDAGFGATGFDGGSVTPMDVRGCRPGAGTVRSPNASMRSIQPLMANIGMWIVRLLTWLSVTEVQVIKGTLPVVASVDAKNVS